MHCDAWTLRDYALAGAGQWWNSRESDIAAVWPLAYIKWASNFVRLKHRWRVLVNLPHAFKVHIHSSTYHRTVLVHELMFLPGDKQIKNRTGVWTAEKVKFTKWRCEGMASPHQFHLIVMAIVVNAINTELVLGSSVNSLRASKFLHRRY